MRIVSYNILDGGEGRADPLAEVILAQRPDIVALVEADNAAVLERIARRTGMDFIHATGGRSGAALLSRWPIRETIDHALAKPAAGKAFLEATVVEPTGGAEWVVGVVHLTAHASEQSESRREKEIAVVLDRFSDLRSRGVPHLLVGDFNSNAPSQWIDPSRCKAATQREFKENGGMIPRRVVAQILRSGYLDTMAVVGPRASTTAGSFTTQQPGQRVDFVFAFGIDEPRIRSAWIETDRLAKYASDHFPIGAEFE